MGRKIIASGSCFCKRFKCPSKAQEVAAVSDDTGVWIPILEADGCPALPKLRHGSWLCVAEERGQTVSSFQRLSCRASLHSTYDTLFLQPLGWDDDEAVAMGAPLPAVAAYLQAFFPGVKVESLAPSADADVQPSRAHPDEGHPQILTGDAYAALRKIRGRREVARTAIGVVGVTTQDLYAGEEWDHLCGEALPLDSVAAVSWWRMGRWDADNVSAPGDGSPPPPPVVLQRTVRTLSHEVCHLFGLHHCIYRHCLMNGTNDQTESDARPGSLCTLCLRKLHLALTSPPGARKNTTVTGEHTLAWINDRYALLQAWNEDNNIDDPVFEHLVAVSRGA